jgi:hypothetical protein
MSNIFGNIFGVPTDREGVSLHKCDGFEVHGEYWLFTKRGSTPPPVGATLTAKEEFNGRELTYAITVASEPTQTIPPIAPGWASHTSVSWTAKPIAQAVV